MVHFKNITKIIDLPGHIGSIYGLASRKNDSFFYSVGGDGWITKWHSDGVLADGLLIATTDTKLFSVVLHPTLDILVAGDINGHLFWIDTHNNVILARIVAHNHSIFDILILDDGTMLSISADGYMTVWDFNHRLPILSIQISNQGLRCAVYEEVEKKIYIGSSDNSIYIVNKNDWHIEKVIKNAHQNSVFTLAIINQKFLASGSRDAHLMIRSLDNDTIVNDHSAHWFTINKIIEMPEVKMIATASRDKTFRLWDDTTFDPVTTVDIFKGGHFHSINTMLWIAENKTLITGGDDRVIKLWKIDHS